MPPQEDVLLNQDIEVFKRVLTDMETAERLSELGELCANAGYTLRRAAHRIFSTPAHAGADPVPGLHGPTPSGSELPARTVPSIGAVFSGGLPEFSTITNVCSTAVARAYAALTAGRAPAIRAACAELADVCLVVSTTLDASQPRSNGRAISGLDTDSSLGAYLPRIPPLATPRIDQLVSVCVDVLDSKYIATPSSL